MSVSERQNLHSRNLHIMSCLDDNLTMVIIDGENICHAYGNQFRKVYSKYSKENKLENRFFGCALPIVKNYYQRRQTKCEIYLKYELSERTRYRPWPEDILAIKKLEQEGYITYPPSMRTYQLNGLLEMKISYPDDWCILQTAISKNAFVISNDKFRNEFEYASVSNFINSSADHQSTQFNDVLHLIMNNIRAFRWNIQEFNQTTGPKHLIFTPLVGINSNQWPLYSSRSSSRAVSTSSVTTRPPTPIQNSPRAPTPRNTPPRTSNLAAKQATKMTRATQTDTLYLCIPTHNISRPSTSESTPSTTINLASKQIAKLSKATQTDISTIKPPTWADKVKNRRKK